MERVVNIGSIKWRGPLNALAGPIIFLATQGISDLFLRRELGVTGGHVRVLRHRLRKDSSPRAFDPDLCEDTWAKTPSSDASEPDKYFLRLEATVRQVFEQASKSSCYQIGIEELRKLRGFIGSVVYIERRQLLAEIHEYLAQCYLNTDHLYSCLQNAHYSMRRALEAYKSEYGSSRDLEAYLLSCSTAARAELLRGNAEAAKELLEGSLTALERAKSTEEIAPNYRIFRLLGRYWLWRDKHLAEYWFSKASEAARAQHKACNAVHIEMLRRRELNVVDENEWEGSIEMVKGAFKTFGDRSLRGGLMAIWASAAAFMRTQHNTDKTAMSLINLNWDTIQFYPRLTVVAALLILTTKLPFDSGFRREWIRLVLSLHIYADK